MQLRERGGEAAGIDDERVAGVLEAEGGVFVLRDAHIAIQSPSGPGDTREMRAGAAPICPARRTHGILF
ncbi:hypothetical protein GCM10027064_20710 [Microbacterium petrolearium]